MPFLFEAVDIYCERTDTGLFNEPLNALSNLAFFIAAALLLKLYRASGHRDSATATLIGMIAIVGFGSLLFHTAANQISMIADVVPIMALVFYYLWVALRRLVGVTRTTAILLLVAFIGVAALIAEVPDPYRFNGSIAYFPCLGALLLIAWACRKRAHSAAKDILKASAWLAVSLTFRSIDMATCETVSLGTHFLWHACNGVVLYLLARTILQHPARQPA